MGTTAPLEPLPTGGCGRGQEFDSVLLITTLTCDPTCPGWPETRSLGAKSSLCTAESFHTLWVEVLF